MRILAKIQELADEFANAVYDLYMDVLGMADEADKDIETAQKSGEPKYRKWLLVVAFLAISFLANYLLKGSGGTEITNNQDVNGVLVSGGEVGTINNTNITVPKLYADTQTVYLYGDPLTNVVKLDNAGELLPESAWANNLTKDTNPTHFVVLVLNPGVHVLGPKNLPLGGTAYGTYGPRTKYLFSRYENIDENKSREIESEGRIFKVTLMGTRDLSTETFTNVEYKFQINEVIR